MPSYYFHGRDEISSGCQEFNKEDKLIFVFNFYFWFLLLLLIGNRVFANCSGVLEKLTLEVFW